MFLHLEAGLVRGVGVDPFVSVGVDVDCDEDVEALEELLEDHGLGLGKGSASVVLLPTGVFRALNCSER